MTMTPRIFAQAKPSGSPNESLLYTLPFGTTGQVTLFVCNQSNAVDFFRIALVPTGGNVNTARYVAYDTPITGNGVFAMSGIGLSSNDSIYIKSQNGDLSFTATGVEYS